MQFKLATLACLTIASFAAATPLVARGNGEGSPPQPSANSATAAGLLALLGVVVQDVTEQIGMTCSPITAIGIGANSCTAQPVCCENNDFNGLIALGCSPVSL